MKYFVLGLTVLTSTLAVQPAGAAEYVCASMPHAEDAVKDALNLDPADKVPTAIQGEEEYLSGGQYVFRKILVNVYDGHTGRTGKYIVSYTIIKSFDGPDGFGDYCDLTAVEKAEVVCARDPKLKLCK